MNLNALTFISSRFINATAIRLVMTPFVLCAALAIMPISAAPIMQVLELSHEGALVTYSVGEAGNGKAIVSMCDTCGEFVELDITPQTRLILDGKEVSFAEHPTADKSRMTVFYLPDENRLTRIVATSPPR